MKQNNVIKLSFAIVISVVMACNQPESVDKNNTTDTTTSGINKDTSSMPVYDAAMDPLTVEAKYAKPLADTLGIKMYEITLKPGDSAAIHTHPDYTFYVLQGGKIAITSEGKRQEMDVKTGMGVIFGGLTHSGKNIGSTTIRLLISDIYRPRGN
jgi:quercetin dioxygenase-like cupin family protein